MSENSTVEQKLKQANALYGEKKYKEAVEIWQSVSAESASAQYMPGI